MRQRISEDIGKGGSVHTIFKKEVEPIEKRFYSRELEGR
jgi:hypothetical protein